MDMIPKKVINSWMSNDLPVDIRHQWVEHTRATHPDAFPRNIGYPQSGTRFDDQSGFVRYNVDSPKQLIEVGFDNMSDSDMYTDVFSKTWQRNQHFDTCYIDLDMDFDISKSDNEQEKVSKFKTGLKEVHWDMKKFIWYMERTFDTVPRVYFSGGRGFSIYTDFDWIDEKYEVIYRTIVDLMRNEAEVRNEFIDESVFEKNRLSRLPYTLNWSNMDKRGMDPLFCIPIDPKWSFEEMWNEITEPSKFKKVEVDRSRKLSNYIGKSDIEPSHDTKKWDSDTSPDPETSLEKVEFLMDKAHHIRDGRHRILHFIMVPALLEAGWTTNDQVHKMCQEFIDRTNESYYPEYHDYVENSIDRTLEGPPGSDEKWRPWSIPKFIQKNSDLLSEFIQ